jgi:hypothetical protein
VRRAILIYSGAVSILLGAGCKAPLGDVISQALSSTNVTFQPHFQEPIALSPPQSQTIRSIVARFHQRSQVRINGDTPVPDGVFILGDVRFRWFANVLYIYDEKTKRYYVVKDPILEKMMKAFFKAQGTKPPLQDPSRAQWLEILSVLEKTN